MKFFNHYLGRKIYVIFLTILLTTFFGVVENSQFVSAQEETSENNNSTQIAETPSPTPAPTPIPLADIVAQSEETAVQLRKIEKGLDENLSMSLIEIELPKLAKDIDSRTGETSTLLASKPSLETLRTIEQDWTGLAASFPVWKEKLGKRIEIYNVIDQELRYLDEKWQQTLAEYDISAEDSVKTATGKSNSIANDSSTNTNSYSALSKENPPPALLKIIRSTIAAITTAKEKINKKRTSLLTIQSRLSKEESRINETLLSVAKIREEALTNLFVQDSPAIWAARHRTDSLASLWNETKNSISDQTAALATYFSAKRERFILHGLIFVLIAGLLFRTRKRMKDWVEDEPKLERAFTVFKLPIVSSLILSVMLSSTLYTQQPRMLSVIIGAVALIPGVIFLRRILERPMFPILNALVVFYFIDRLRDLAASLPLLSRILLLAELIGAGIFLVWFLRSKRLTKGITDKHHRIFTIIRKAIPVVLVLFFISVVANVLGYVSLSAIIGSGVLGCCYVALILYTAVQLVESLLVFAFRSRPLTLLGMVQTHRSLLLQRAFYLIWWIAFLWWFWITLSIFSIKDAVYNFAAGILTAKLEIGSIAISAGDVLLFGFIVWLAFALSKLIRFVLDEDVYPRVNLGGGVPYAVSTMLHYVLLVIGFIFAVAALGLDLTKFTILAGAFGVGLGFGLQNIVNNFVSGLILLFERPVKVDDVVQIGAHLGDLKRIGLRASVLRTVDGSEIIVPNGQLISEEVINWTLSDQSRRIEINFGVAYGTDPRRVIEIASQAAMENEDIVSDSPPRTIFVGFGDSSLDFQLRAWTDNADNWVVIKSEVSLALHDALVAADIEIPFPQRVVYLNKAEKEMPD